MKNFFKKIKLIAIGFTSILSQAHAQTVSIPIHTSKNIYGQKESWISDKEASSMISKLMRSGKLKYNKESGTFEMRESLANILDSRNLVEEVYSVRGTDCDQAP